MLEVGRIAYVVVQLFEPPGRWLFVKIVVVAFSVTAIGRLVPWTPRRSVSKKSRRAILGMWGVAALVLLCGLAGAGVVVTKAEALYTAFTNRPAHASLAADRGRYLGIYEPGTPGTYRPVQRFMTATRSRPAIDLYYSSWGTPFIATFADDAYQHHATTLIQMEPSGPGVSLSGIADGKDDGYLRAFAIAIRTFRHPVIIGFGPEMNGNWYPWGYTRASPASFVAAWRHVVTVFRAYGADNVTWLWTANEVYNGSGPLTDYWPGSKYVTWVGIDAYFVPTSHKFAKVIGPTLKQIRRITSEPVIISETGIAPQAGKATVLKQLFAGVRSDDLLGFIYFDGNQLEDADYHFEWRLEDSPGAVDAYGLLARENARQPHPAVSAAPVPAASSPGSASPSGSAPPSDSASPADSAEPSDSASP